MATQYLSRTIKLPESCSEIKSRFRNDHWAMTDAERSALSALLNKLQPDCAIEVGTYKGGSLGVISRYCKQVYTLDIDPANSVDNQNKNSNVEFVIGDSNDTLPPLLKNIQRSNVPLGFVLIDADHSEEGVRRDIEHVLNYIPSQPLYIIMHDSFNPGCRKGILKANWSVNPHVHLVEADYVLGRFISKEEKKLYREMWCGFALAILLPEKREGDVIIHENEYLMYKTAFWRSVYPYKKILSLSLLRKMIRYVKHNGGGKIRVT